MKQITLWSGGQTNYDTRVIWFHCQLFSNESKIQDPKSQIFGRHGSLPVGGKISLGCHLLIGWR